MTVKLLDIAVLVFREGLESILVLAALTASMTGARRRFRRPVAVGAGAGLLATLLTWRIVVGLLDSFAESIPALDIQAATGLLAILVLLLVMNWFFHKVYWTGWISMHSQRKQALLQRASAGRASDGRLYAGLALLGFSSLYREGFEVVLFLQSYRLKLGLAPVVDGVLVGAVLTAIVGVLTFAAHRRLPYRRMLVLTGVLLGFVLLVMVGEQAQEMQLAGWLPTTPVRVLEPFVPAWAGLWFSVFPTVETLVGQGVAAVLVLGSYLAAGHEARKRTRAALRDPFTPAPETR